MTTRKPKEEPTTLTWNPYGFNWGGVLVERTASINYPRKFRLLRVFALNGEVIEIQMSPRKTIVTVVPKERKK